MFFIRLGSFVAWALVVLGSIRVLFGLLIAFGTSAADKAVAERNILGSATSGEAIDQGLIALVAGVVIGLLVRITTNTNEK